MKIAMIVSTVLMICICAIMYYFSFVRYTEFLIIPENLHTSINIRSDFGRVKEILENELLCARICFKKDGEFIPVDRYRYVAQSSSIVYDDLRPQDKPEMIANLCIIKSSDLDKELYVILFRRNKDYLWISSEEYLITRDNFVNQKDANLLMLNRNMVQFPFDFSGNVGGPVKSSSGIPDRSK